MNTLAKQLNKTLGPAADFLSAEGRRMYFPYGGILGQGAEAKACGINATIGMAFEEDGSPLVMDCFAKNINLDRKVLADLAVNNPEAFKAIVNTVKEK